MIFDKRAELNVLINLAASDKNVAAREAKLIHLIGKANGIAKEEIDAMLEKPMPISSINTLTPDEKFAHLYYLIQLMKMDGQVFRSEIIFCEQIAERLGYKKGVVGELSQHIYSDPTITADRDMLRKKAEKYLREE
ncbi:MAG TPA: TerB family tellurite resistance protein [Cyclobacteriaceae bacterium]|nr:TerB family tellurite resistance protein [Cyclobacteriaceae bacterium]